MTARRALLLTATVLLAAALTSGLALAQTPPKPPAGGDIGQWVIWGAVALGTVALSTTGQLLIVVASAIRSAKGDARPLECKASGPCAFDPTLADTVHRIHRGLYWVDAEGTSRPVLSGQRRQQQIEDSRRTLEALERLVALKESETATLATLVAQGNRQTELLENLQHSFEAEGSEGE